MDTYLAQQAQREVGLIILISFTIVKLFFCRIELGSLLTKLSYLKDNFCHIFNMASSGLRKKFTL